MFKYTLKIYIASTKTLHSSVICTRCKVNLHDWVHPNFEKKMEKSGDLWKYFHELT